MLEVYTNLRSPFANNPPFRVCPYVFQCPSYPNKNIRLYSAPLISFPQQQQQQEPKCMKLVKRDGYYKNTEEMPKSTQHKGAMLEPQVCQH